MVRPPFLATGIAAVSASTVLLLLPFRAEGVSGNAIRPHYGPFGWFSYEPLPEHPTRADLRRAGVASPRDAVRARRGQAAVLGILGALLLLAGVLPRS